MSPSKYEELCHGHFGGMLQDLQVANNFFCKRLHANAFANAWQASKASHLMSLSLSCRQEMAMVVALCRPPPLAREATAFNNPSA
jgi:hypothetical protein